MATATPAGVEQMWLADGQNDAFDPKRSSASELTNRSYAWPHAEILSSALVMRSSAFITAALAAKL
jgi:isocitrate/isopropylmalate dehydrogenase